VEDFKVPAAGPHELDQRYPHHTYPRKSCHGWDGGRPIVNWKGIDSELVAVCLSLNDEQRIEKKNVKRETRRSDIEYDRYPELTYR
jgi:hypothetical protein